MGVLLRAAQRLRISRIRLGATNAEPLLTASRIAAMTQRSPDSPMANAAGEKDLTNSASSSRSSGVAGRPFAAS
jgi:hypothetical protein